MVGKTKPSEWQSGKIRNWLLTILRFAVTRDDADRISVLEVARELDRQGMEDGNPSFSFFLRTTAEICSAIVSDDRTRRETVLARHFNAINDQRLLDALKAATKNRPARQASSKPAKRTREYLWRGLRSR